LAQEIYPDWICRFYLGSSVPAPIKIELNNFDNVEIVSMDQWGDWRGMFWRFLPASEPGVEVMISYYERSSISQVPGFRRNVGSKSRNPT